MRVNPPLPPRQQCARGEANKWVHRETRARAGAGTVLIRTPAMHARTYPLGPPLSPQLSSSPSFNTVQYIYIYIYTQAAPTLLYDAFLCCGRKKKRIFFLHRKTYPLISLFFEQEKKTAFMGYVRVYGGPDTIMQIRK